MDKETANNWIVYHEIHRLLREDLSLEAIAEAFNMDLSTVKKYAELRETDIFQIDDQYFALEELPYGYQAMADFGVSFIRDEKATRRKIYFFVMMLTSSQMLFLRFSEVPFTIDTVIDTHEQAFELFKGIPKEVLYDLERLHIHPANTLMTPDFKTYAFEQEFRIQFCSTANPNYKGQITGITSFIKNKFLSGRIYKDIQTLQSQAEEWLDTIGNGMPFSFKKRLPMQEWLIEQNYLGSWCSVKLLPSYILRSVNKDNTFFYNGKFYSVPIGTYQKKDNFLRIFLKDDELHVYDDLQDKYLCKHLITWE